MDAKKELEALIEEGNIVKRSCYHPDTDTGLYDYISGDAYVAWIMKCKLFIKSNIGDREIYEGFSKVGEKANGFGVDRFEEMMGTLKGLLSYDFSEKDNKVEKIEKIFISHSSKDEEYVSNLVTLLNDIGIKKSSNHIFCSSLPGYDIPYGQNIYDFLKDELNKNNIMVLFVLSDNYYTSAPCLNEMGAAWVTSKESNFILTPNFDFGKISGAIDPSKISLKINDTNGLDKFRDKIVEIFDLERIDYKIWQEDRNKFITNINGIAKEEEIKMIVDIQIEKVKKLSEEEGVEIYLRFTNFTDRDIEFKFIDLKLVDTFGNELSVSVNDKILDDFCLYNRENKIFKLVFENKTEYNPRRDDNSLSKVYFDIHK